MAHLRQQILDQIRVDLQAPAQSLGAMVSPMRASSVPEEDLPAFTVLYTSDSSEPDGVVFDAVTGKDLTRYTHRMIVNIIIHFKGRKDPSREFDQLASVIEQALPPSDLGGLVIDMLLSSTDMFIDPQTASSLGAGRMVFEVTYRSFAGIPDRAA